MIWSNGKKHHHIVCECVERRARETTTNRTNAPKKTTDFWFSSTDKMQWYYFFARSLPWHAIFPIYIYFLFFLLDSHSTALTSFSFCVHISSSLFSLLFYSLCEANKRASEWVSERLCREREYVCGSSYRMLVYIWRCLYVLFVFELISCMCSRCVFRMACMGCWGVPRSDEVSWTASKRHI